MSAEVVPYRRSPERRAAYKRQWRIDNPDLVARANERDMLRREQLSLYNPTWRRDQHLRLTYGITQQQWDELFLKQGRSCAACKRHDAGRTKFGKGACWHTDHNPKYKKDDLRFVRGILCHWCNLAAHRHQTPATLRALADYLEQHP